MILFHDFTFQQISAGYNKCEMIWHNDKADIATPYEVTVIIFKGTRAKPGVAVKAHGI